MKQSYIPEGDAQAGRAAFLYFKCNSCHTVARDAGIICPDPPLIDGPKLTFGTPEHSRESIATAIIAPPHTIAESYGAGDPEEVQFSRMVDFSDRMTVRQLIDIVTYLKSKKYNRNPDDPRDPVEVISAPAE